MYLVFVKLLQCTLAVLLNKDFETASTYKYLQMSGQSSVIQGLN